MGIGRFAIGPGLWWVFAGYVAGMKNAAAERIRHEVSSWPNVTAKPHRFGGVEFVVGRREIGHLHGGHLVDLPFPMPNHDELIAAGRARVHHVLPDSGWVSFPIKTEEDVNHAIELLRLNYERPWHTEHDSETRG
jgi:hypothetical protein